MHRSLIMKYVGSTISFFILSLFIRDYSYVVVFFAFVGLDAT